MKFKDNRNYCTNHLLISAFKIMIGLFIIGFGGAIMLKVGLGSPPQATIIEGASVFFKMDYAMGGLLINIIFFIILFFLDRELISVGTVLLLLTGFLIEISTYIIDPLNLNLLSYPMKIVAVIIGSIITGIGTGYYVSINAGVGAIDAMGIVLFKRTKLSMQMTRWITDILIFIIGVLMGGTWGIGTIISIIIVGPVMQIVLKFMDEKNKKKINKCDIK